MRKESLAALLGRDDLPGTPAELAVLATRIEELIRANGEQWVVDHRRKLVREWSYIVEQGVIRPADGG